MSIAIDRGKDRVGIAVAGAWTAAARTIGDGATVVVQHGTDPPYAFDAEQGAAGWVCPALEPAEIPAIVKSLARRALRQLPTTL
ncbi:hypothetical protein ORI20_13975 [Mycobacterium sp. CVI_P3]|uniref:Uncharacterized protein n=1 Tax=Mycobacterium pinniadriaticum TaxID=2994102 RepID=A0ABT3SEK0_9MYCO|nr:hypothetical protein [Mycobacterium pinniadriaticum]MCX2931388.1 hypothetical protein [Mycobacterium pinniadriaticum]MCX2937812.1 hypothetical protein [Mycobacterium pinniadriaticum]